MKIITSCALLICTQIIMADSSSTREQYESELISIQQKEITAREMIALEQTRVESLKQEIKLVTSELSDATVEKYSLLGVDEQGLKEFELELKSIKSNLEKILTADPATIELFADQVEQISHTIANYRQRKVSGLYSVAQQLQSCEETLQKINSVIEQQQAKQNTDNLKDSISLSLQDTSSENNNTGELPDTWVVKEKGDKYESLFIIAGYPEVYGDVNKWHLLYQANKELIDQNFQTFLKNRQNSKDINPQDVIFPGQILKIPR